MHSCNVYKLGFTHSHLPITMLCILVLFFGFAHAVPVDLPLNLNTFKNLTATNRCSSSQECQAYAFLIEDCFTAIQRVYIEEVIRRPDEMYEFFAGGTYPKTSKPWVRTPSQYTVSEYTHIHIYHTSSQLTFAR